VLQSYIDSGKVDLVYKHSAFLGQESVWAAQAQNAPPIKASSGNITICSLTSRPVERRHLYQRNLMAYAKDLVSIRPNLIRA
jgi:hypothetical protein